MYNNNVVIMPKHVGAGHIKEHCTLGVLAEGIGLDIKCGITEIDNPTESERMFEVYKAVNEWLTDFFGLDEWGDVYRTIYYHNDMTKNPEARREYCKWILEGLGLVVVDPYERPPAFPLPSQQSKKSPQALLPREQEVPVG